MNQLITVPQHYDLAPIVSLVTDSVDSHHTKRAYARALTAVPKKPGRPLGFIPWLQQSTYAGNVSKAAVNAYKTYLLDLGQGSSSIGQALSAIRKLATEAADNGYLDQPTAASIERVKGVTKSGRRTGNWLDKEEAKQLVNAPDTETLKGLRDRAILAVMVGTGLRRFEVAKLAWEQIQQREGRWAIVDLVGKRNKVATVPMAAWVKAALDAWQAASGLTTGNVFVSINKGGRIDGDSITAQAVYNVVAEHSQAVGFENLAAHDLRRTAANIAEKGGASLRQIQQLLRHSSIKTTETYLEPMRGLTDTAADYIKIELD